jgi:hypothetical protein
MSNMKERVWSPDGVTPTLPIATLPTTYFARTGLEPATNRLEPSCPAVKDDVISGFPLCFPPALETKIAQCLWQSTVARVINWAPVLQGVSETVGKLHELLSSVPDGHEWSATRPNGFTQFTECWVGSKPFCTNCRRQTCLPLPGLEPLFLSFHPLTSRNDDTPADFSL